MTGRSELDTELHLTCNGELWAIREALLEVETFLKLHGIHTGDIEDIQLVLAEAMTNIARHAYPVGTDQIWLSLRLNASRIECDLLDRGVAFDPSKLGQTPPEPALCNEGGYGWFIIRSLSEGLNYTRKNGCNNLSFSVPIVAMT